MSCCDNDTALHPKQRMQAPHADLHDRQFGCPWPARETKGRFVEAIAIMWKSSRRKFRTANGYVWAVETNFQGPPSMAEAVRAHQETRCRAGRIGEFYGALLAQALSMAATPCKPRCSAAGRKSKSIRNW